VLVALMGAVYVHRQDVLDERGWAVASSLTTTRADGLIWGVVVALALPWLSRMGGWRHVLWISGVVLLALKLVLPELSDFAYLGPWSIAFTFVSGVVVLAIWQLDAPTRISRVLSIAPLRRLGKASLAVFIWHQPIFMILARHTPEWRWETRTAVALLILAVVVVAAERWIDEPIRRLLATRPVFRIRRPAVAVEPPPPAATVEAATGSDAGARS
jgi:peptidoglycan/LPS O-acetylase OafA/YrhL